MKAAAPKSLSATVLPPAFGPLITSALTQPPLPIGPPSMPPLPRVPSMLLLLLLLLLSLLPLSLVFPCPNIKSLAIV
jgi:hypothetical protein